ncbi:MAG: peptidoglycan DD-metalloendopeptidase family protein [Hyphomicrobiaceae bacterium]
MDGRRWQGGRCRGCLGWLLAAVVLVGLAGPASAADSKKAAAGSDLTREEARKRLEEEQKGLDETRRKASELEENVAQLAREREDLNRRLIETARRIQDGEAELSTIEGRLGELGQQEKLIRGSLETQQRTISKLLMSLQRMGRNPPPVMITRRDDALAQVRSAMMLARVFPELRDKAVALADKLSELDRVISGIRENRDRLASEREALAAEHTRLDELMVVKREELEKSETALGELQALAKAQARTVTDLGELIARLDKAVGEQGTLAEYERKLEEGTAPGQAETALAAPSGDAGSGTETSGRDGGRTTFSNQPVTTALFSPARIEPAIPFEKAKGRLPLPAKGRRLFGFGDPTQHETRANGVAFATREGAQITSPSDGWVVYADEFRSYGQLLIINAGGGYHVLLAGLSQISVQVGQFVLSGEPVGKMGATGQSGGQTGDGGSPILYVEFRRKERPIDPDPWWAREPEKVQG